MDTSKGNPKTISMFSSLCKAGDHAPFVRPDEVQAVEGICKGDSVSLVTCVNPHKQEFLDDVGGLGFNTVRLRKDFSVALPPFIPTIPKAFKAINPDLIQSEVVAVSIRDIVSRPHNSGGVLKGALNFKVDEKFLKHRIFKEKTVIVLMSGTDCLLEENLWPNYEKVLQALASHGIKAITGVNFSVIKGECPFGQRLNQKRSLVSSQKTEEAGMIAIPHIYAYNQYHREDYLDFLKNNPEINLVTINGSLENENLEDMKEVKETIAYLLRNVGRELHILLQGVSFHHFYDMCEFIPYLHFSLLTPSYNALFHQENVYNPQSRTFKQVFSNLPKDELMLKNLSIYERACSGICTPFDESDF